VTSQRNIGGAAVERFFAALFMTIGGLITLLCGACTAYWLGSAIISVLPHSMGGPATPVDAYTKGWAQVIGVGALLIGGLPTAVGMVIFWAGLRRYRRGARHSDAKHD
jgi:hypothetical protein